MPGIDDASGNAALSSAGDQLKFLNRYAEHYRALVTGTGSSPIAEFGSPRGGLGCLSHTSVGSTG